MGAFFSAPSSQDFALRLAKALYSGLPIGEVLPEVAGALHAHDYALLRISSTSGPCYVISASKPISKAGNLHQRLLHGSPKTENVSANNSIFKLGQANYITSVGIDETVRLLLFSATPVELNSADQDLISTALQFMLKKCPYDPKFLLQRAQRVAHTKMTKLASRGFSIDAVSDDNVFAQTIAIFYTFLDDLNVDKVEFVNLAVDIRSMYNDVPYHNWRHAADTVQFIYSVFRTAPVDKYLNEMERFAVLFAAMCHDTDHDGRNNTYQRKADTVLAQLAPGMPPLELHHADCAMQALNIRHKKVLAAWSETDIRYFQKFVISCILATDMEKHKEFLERFGKTRAEFDSTKEEHRILLGQIIMKAADLSNTVRDFSDAEVMTEKLINECFLQGDREVELGLEVSPMCDRKSAKPIPFGQIGFYKFVAGPLMSELHAFFPELEENAKQYEDNLARWTKLTENLSE